MTTPGYVLFRLGTRTFATALTDVREIVRLTGLESLPGTQPPLAGVLVLRGTPLPVLDVREQGRADAVRTQGRLLTRKAGVLLRLRYSYLSQAGMETCRSPQSETPISYSGDPDDILDRCGKIVTP